METTRKRERRRARHVLSLSRRAIREAGTPSHIGEAVGVTRSAASHWTSDRVNPVLRDAFALLIRLDAHPGLSGRAFAEAVAEVVELSEIVHVSDAVLIERGVYLLGWITEAGRRERVAGLRRRGHADELRRVASAAAELAQIMDEATARGMDLYVRFDARELAA